VLNAVPSRIGRNLLEPHRWTALVWIVLGCDWLGKPLGVVTAIRAWFVPPHALRIDPAATVVVKVRVLGIQPVCPVRDRGCEPHLERGVGRFPTVDIRQLDDPLDDAVTSIDQLRQSAPHKQSTGHCPESGSAGLDMQERFGVFIRTEVHVPPYGMGTKGCTLSGSRRGPWPGKSGAVNRMRLSVSTRGGCGLGDPSRIAGTGSSDKKAAARRVCLPEGR
jgi:hypothetical protein